MFKPMVPAAARSTLSAKTVLGSFSCAGTSRYLHTTMRNENDDRLKELYAKFQDPTSHYHIPSGTSGPEHEDDHSTSRAPVSPPSSSASSSSSSSARATSNGRSGARRDILDDRPWLNPGSSAEKDALRHFRSEGHDVVGVLKWPVAWGDCDMFQHVNNVKILQWFESARIRYTESWANEFPPGVVQDMLHAKGMGIILKDVSVKYKAPVTYPDTIMISNKIHSIRPERGSFGMRHLAWSMKDQRVTAVCDSTIVMYDYDNVKKGVMSAEFQQVLEKIEASYSSPDE